MQSKRPRRNTARSYSAMIVAAACASICLHPYAADARGPAPATAPRAAATTSQPATKPALQADAILSRFPGNAGTLASRSDARNFTVEGRVREVRSIAVDAPARGGAISSIIGPAKTEIRVVLVGRAQADDLPAHFTCHFDASEDAALRLKPDQIVRVTGSIGPPATAADRIDLLNCHDLVEVGPINVGDQLVGMWRSTEVMVDGAAQRKSNQTRGIKIEGIPEVPYAPPWRLDMVLKADGSMVAELAETATGQILKKLTGRYQVLNDAPESARLRLSLQNTAPQETDASLAQGRLRITLPGLSDRFILPDTRFGKVEGVMLGIDNKSLRDQALRWFSANVPQQISVNANAATQRIEATLTANRDYIIKVGAGTIRRGRTTFIYGNSGKFSVLECSDAQTQLDTNDRMVVLFSELARWGVPCVPEVKIEQLTIDNLARFDPAQSMSGKITIRALRRPYAGQYVFIAATGGSHVEFPLKGLPSADPQTIDFDLDPIHGMQTNPRLVFFSIGRRAKPGDLYGDTANRIVSETLPLLLNIPR